MNNNSNPRSTINSTVPEYRPVMASTSDSNEVNNLDAASNSNSQSLGRAANFTTGSFQGMDDQTIDQFIAQEMGSQYQMVVSRRSSSASATSTMTQSEAIMSPNSSPMAQSGGTASPTSYTNPMLHSSSTISASNLASRIASSQDVNELMAVIHAFVITNHGLSFMLGREDPKTSYGFRATREARLRSAIGGNQFFVSNPENHTGNDSPHVRNPTTSIIRPTLGSTNMMRAMRAAARASVAAVEKTDPDEDVPRIPQTIEEFHYVPEVTEQDSQPANDVGSNVEPQEQGLVPQAGTTDLPQGPVDMVLAKHEYAAALKVQMLNEGKRIPIDGVQSLYTEKEFADLAEAWEIKKRCDLRFAADERNRASEMKQRMHRNWAEARQIRRRGAVTSAKEQRNREVEMRKRVGEEWSRDFNEGVKEYKEKSVAVVEGEGI